METFATKVIIIGPYLKIQGVSTLFRFQIFLSPNISKKKFHTINSWFRKRVFNDYLLMYTEWRKNELFLISILFDKITKNIILYL